MGQAVSPGEQGAHVASGATWICPVATEKAVCLLKVALSQRQRGGVSAK